MLKYKLKQISFEEDWSFLSVEILTHKGINLVQEILTVMASKIEIIN